MKNFMSKHATQAAFTAAQSTFDHPHVSLIEELKALGVISTMYRKKLGRVITAPVANELTENGEAQVVASAGLGTGTMMYRLGETGDFSTSMPTATEAGTYTLYYYAAENNKYQASSISSINIVIESARYYLTIVSLANNNKIKWKAYDPNLTKSISVSIDNGNTWTSYTSSTGGKTLATLNNGQKMLIKGSNTAYGNSSSFGQYNYFTSTDNFNIEGNIMSLIYGDNFIGQTSLTAAYTFSHLFYKCTNLVSAENLILPATTLANICYEYMFFGCTSLVKTPELPATTLASWCYNGMFSGCTSLVEAPELPATTLAQECYEAMFNGCTSLVKAPELPATTLAYDCYYSMFCDCTSLTEAPELRATTLATGCYKSMFDGCTSLVKAPELPASTLAYECYEGMFYGCTSLNYIKCLATNLEFSSCLLDWVQNVASTGTFVKADTMNSWASGKNGIPTGWDKMNNSELPITWNNNEEYLTNSSIKPTLINPFNLSVTYSSSDTNVATIDNSGNVTFVSTGTVTLTAIFEGNEQFEAKTTMCTLTISEPITLCTLYDSSNNVLAQIEGPSTTLTQSLVSSYKSSTYKVIIGSDCTSIETEVFKQFTNLCSITISSNVSTIGNSAFYSCTSLKEIICNRTTAPSLGNNNVFYNVARGGVLITPSGSSGYNTWMSTSYYYLGYYQWYNAVGTFGDTEPTLQWSSSSYTITSDYFSTPTLSKQSGISVTYKSSNTSVATINSSGTVSKGSNGTTYIQAIFAGNSTYKPKVATYALTVSIYSGGSSGGGGGGE